MSGAYRCDLIPGSSSKPLRECTWQLAAGTEVLGTAEPGTANTAHRFAGEGITVGVATALGQKHFIISCSALCIKSSLFSVCRHVMGLRMAPLMGFPSDSLKEETC